LAEFLLPKLATGSAGTLQLQQGHDASAFAKQRFQERLTRPDGSTRRLFVRIADSPFDDNGRLLGYVAPNYSDQERRTMTRQQRATFNLDLVERGHAAPVVIYPSIPGELDLPLLLEAASAAVSEPRGIWANAQTLLAYEYRAVEKLFRVTRKLVNGQPLKPGEALGWRERYCVDMRTRTLHGPEDYFAISPQYRLWIWSRDLNQATGRLNLVPSPRLVAAQ